MKTAILPRPESSPSTSSTSESSSGVWHESLDDLQIANRSLTQAEQRNSIGFSPSSLRSMIVRAPSSERRSNRKRASK